MGALELAYNSPFMEKFDRGGVGMIFSIEVDLYFTYKNDFRVYLGYFELTTANFFLHGQPLTRPTIPPL